MFIPKKRGRRVMRKRTYRKKSVRKVSTSVKKYVKTAIAKSAENKVVNIEVAREFGSYLDSNTMNVFPMTPYTTLFPGPTLGVASNNRIGNQIRARKVMLNYTLRAASYNATTNPVPQPVHVQMYLGYVKQMSGVLPTSSDYNFFYNNGSSSFAPSGTLSDLVAQVNTDQFTILKSWVHKIGYSTNTGTGSTNAASAQGQFFANNDYNLNVVRKMNITKHYPKILKFNDALQSVQGRGLFLWYQAISSTGVALATGIRPVAVNFWVQLEFEDN